MIRKLAAVFAVLLVIFAANTATAFDFSKIEKQVVEFQLDNGLRFVVLQDNEAPVVYFRTIVKVGGASDPRGMAGIAHMFEHMAFKGTREIGTNNPTEELAWMAVEDSLFGLILKEEAKLENADQARLDELRAELKTATDSATSFVETNAWGTIYQEYGGVDLNAGTGYDQTMYIANYPANRLELWFAMESDRFSNPVLREFYKEKEVIAEERRMSRESSPQGKLMEELLGAAFLAHPYGMSLIGPMSDINHYYRPEALAFFEQYYVPSNMVISIVGDVDINRVKKLAEQYFGPIPYQPAPMPVLTEEAPQNGFRKVVVKDKAQPIYITGFHIPGGNDPDFVALEALADYLGQGRTSLLYKDLVKEKKIAIQAAAFAGFPGDYYPTLFGVLAVPSKDHSNEENDQAIVEIIEKLKSEAIPEAEMEKIKARAKASLINQISNNGGWGGMASQLASHELLYGGWEKLFKRLDAINALTADDLKRVANKYLDINKRTTALLEPEEA